MTACGAIIGGLRKEQTPLISALKSCSHYCQYLVHVFFVSFCSGVLYSYVKNTLTLPSGSAQLKPLWKRKKQFVVQGYMGERCPLNMALSALKANTMSGDQLRYENGRESRAVSLAILSICVSIDRNVTVDSHRFTVHGIVSRFQGVKLDEISLQNKRKKK